MALVLPVLLLVPAALAGQPLPGCPPDPSLLLDRSHPAARRGPVSLPNHRRQARRRVHPDWLPHPDQWRGSGRMTRDCRDDAGYLYRDNRIRIREDRRRQRRNSHFRLRMTETCARNNQLMRTDVMDRYGRNDGRSGPRIHRRRAKTKKCGQGGNEIRQDQDAGRVRETRLPMVDG